MTPDPYGFITVPYLVLHEACLVKPARSRKRAGSAKSKWTIVSQGNLKCELSVAIDRLSGFNGEVVSHLLHDPGGTGSKTHFPQWGAVSQFSQAFRVSSRQGQKGIYLMPQTLITVFFVEYLYILANSPPILDGLRRLGDIAICASYSS